MLIKLHDSQYFDRLHVIQYVLCQDFKAGGMTGSFLCRTRRESALSGGDSQNFVDVGQREPNRLAFMKMF
jgi:hypothetical protein